MHRELESIRTTAYDGSYSPRVLAKLGQDWYEHPERIETQDAFATWRANIDSSAEDPCEELAFHNALQQLARVLDQTPGLGRPFKAGTTMPVEWSVASST